MFARSSKIKERLLIDFIFFYNSTSIVNRKIKFIDAFHDKTQIMF
jgi:hypothetical protein